MNFLLKNPKVRQTIHIATLWSPLWIGCTVLALVISLVYVMAIKKNVWLASQALTLRDETAGSTVRLGRFESSNHLKAAQETVLDLARNPQVIRNAFKAAGPESSLFGSTADWPSNSYVKTFTESSLSVHAPRGAELGATEVVYLDVKHPSPDRAVQLNKAICDSLEAYMRQVRENRASSIVEEVTQTREKARSDLAKATKRLQEIEKSIGSDLPDLRSMVEIGGGSNSRTALDQLRQEARQLETKHQELEMESSMLAKAVQDPSAFVSAPGSLLNSQPGLKRLREGLVDAQLTLAQLSGKFTNDHPSVTAARNAVDDITERLNRELQAALQNAKQSLEASQASRRRLESQEKDLEERMDRLADSRAIYANIVSEVKTRANILEQTERELAEAEASRIASQSTSLLTRVDQPVVGDKPIGPGKTIIVAGCTIAGFLGGLGLTLLLNPLLSNSTYGRRWNDQENQRRRASDRVEERADAFLGQRASDPGVVRPYGSGTVKEAAAETVDNTQPMTAVVSELRKIAAPTDESLVSNSDVSSGTELEDASLAAVLMAQRDSQPRPKTVPMRRPISEETTEPTKADTSVANTTTRNSTSWKTPAIPSASAAPDSTPVATASSPKTTGERRQLPRRAAPATPPVAVAVRPKSP